MTVKPLGNRLCAKPISLSETTESGLLVRGPREENFRDYDMRQAEVVAVSDEYEGSCKVGDVVYRLPISGAPIYKPYSTEVECFIMGADDIEAKEASSGIVPVGERVLMKPIEEEHKGLIMIPDSAKQKSYLGKIIAIGDDGNPEEGKKKLSESLFVGDEIAYEKQGGTYLIKGGQKYVALLRANILCKLTTTSDDVEYKETTI